MISTAISTKLASLQAQVTAATPLRGASHATLTAIRLNAAQMVSDLDVALIASAGSLDTWQAAADPDVIVSGIVGLAVSANDQSTLALMRGYVGRSAANLNQL